MNIISSPVVFENTGRAIAVTTACASALALQNVKKFLVNVFKSLYLMNFRMDLVDTLPGVRYWSEVLCCAIQTHLSDLEVKTQTLIFYGKAF